MNCLQSFFVFSFTRNLVRIKSGCNSKVAATRCRSRWIYLSNGILGNQLWTRKKNFKKKPWARFEGNFPRSSACAFDQFDVTVEWIPIIFSRGFVRFLTQMGPKVYFAPGAIRMLLCCNKTWGVLQRSHKVVLESFKGLCGLARIGWDIHRSVLFDG